MKKFYCFSLVFFFCFLKTNAVLPEEGVLEIEMDSHQVAIRTAAEERMFEISFLSDVEIQSSIKEVMNSDGMKSQFSRITGLTVKLPAEHSSEALQRCMFLSNVLFNSDATERESEAGKMLPGYGQMPWFQERVFPKLKKVSVVNGVLDHFRKEKIGALFDLDLGAIHFSESDLSDELDALDLKKKERSKSSASTSPKPSGRSTPKSGRTSPKSRPVSPFYGYLKPLDPNNKKKKGSRKKSPPVTEG